MSEFPESSRSVVELALETCSYDEGKARQLLATFNARPATTTTATSHSATGSDRDSRVSITVTAPTVSASSVSADAGMSGVAGITSSSDVSVRLQSSLRPRSALTSGHAGSSDSNSANNSSNSV